MRYEGLSTCPQESGTNRHSPTHAVGPVGRQGPVEGAGSHGEFASVGVFGEFSGNGGAGSCCVRTSPDPA